MQKPDRSIYSPVDFASWKAANSLVLTPKFQRRGVWKPAARSYFIDTLLRGMPVPPIYIRQTQSDEGDRIVREVVDGQQRIAAVLAFTEGGYRLSRTLKAPWSGKAFQELEPSERKRISTYGFSTELFHGISDLEVLEIFSRLNTYSVPLNAQELRNGRFFGLFKQSSYNLALEHLEFWRRHGVFSEQNIARMLEVEFVSEMLVAFLAGMQDKKKSIDEFYEKYDDEFAQQAKCEKRLRDLVNVVNDAFPDGLYSTEFRRSPLFYTLFCTIYHRTVGLTGSDLPETPKRLMSQKDLVSLRSAVELLSEKVETAREKKTSSGRYSAFVSACLRQTDNIKPRTTRLNTLWQTAFE